MEYWKEMYGVSSREFVDGVKAGVEAFAVWKDGEQFVGVLRTPLHKVLDEIEEQLGGDSHGK